MSSSSNDTRLDTQRPADRMPSLAQTERKRVQTPQNRKLETGAQIFFHVFFFSENLNYAPNIREIQVIFVVSFPYIFLSKRIRNLINGKAITLFLQFLAFN